LSKIKPTKDQQFEVLEGKIQDLQSQLKDFESRYQQLEKVALSLSPRSNKKKEKRSELMPNKILMIQQDLEQDPRLILREKSKQKGKRALVELETLKQQAQREDLFGFEIQAKMGAQDVGLSPMYKTFGYSTHSLFLRPC
jgi:hypothetical protein